MWIGQCNGCGMCCRAFLDVAGVPVEFRCTHLVVIGAIGTSGATLCRVHKDKYPEMPIQLESVGGLRCTESSKGTATCAAEYPRPHDAVPPECSYTWSGDPDKKPVWTPGFLPIAELR